MKLEVCLETLSDELLVARLVDLLGRSRRVEAELVAHIAEVDARRLYLREACPSMHAYATERLHLSDAEAYLRITVARLSRRLPIVLDMLADGRLHLSGVARLAPHVGDHGGAELLARAAFLSKRDIERLIAEVAPQPDAPALIRKLPAGRLAAGRDAQRAVAASGLVRGGTVDGPDGSGAQAVIASGLFPAGAVDGPDGSGAQAVAVSGLVPAGAVDVSRGPAPAAAAPAALTPIAPLRYKVQFTAGAELRDKIERARALLRRQVPDGDLAALVDRAVSLLLRDLERARFAATPRPRLVAQDVDSTPRSRHIPAPIRRAVWERDGGQCAFRDRHGRRCPARERIEFHHVTPFAQGGGHSLANVRLACNAHNAYQAELDYGAEFMAAWRRGENRPSARGEAADA